MAKHGRTVVSYLKPAYRLDQKLANCLLCVGGKTPPKQQQFLGVLVFDLSRRRSARTTSSRTVPPPAHAHVSNPQPEPLPPLETPKFVGLCGAVAAENYAGSDVSKAFKSVKAALHQNHVLLTVSRHFIESAAFWFIALEPCCQQQLAIAASGIAPIRIPPARPRPLSVRTCGRRPHRLAACTDDLEPTAGRPARPVRLTRDKSARPRPLPPRTLSRHRPRTGRCCSSLPGKRASHVWRLCRTGPAPRQPHGDPGSMARAPTSGSKLPSGMVCAGFWPMTAYPRPPSPRNCGPRG